MRWQRRSRQEDEEEDDDYDDDDYDDNDITTPAKFADQSSRLQ